MAVPDRGDSTTKLRMENSVKLATMRASVALLAVSGLVLAGCATGSRGGTAPSEGSDLQQVTPEAAGEIDRVTWNSPYGELANLDPVKAFNYPENGVIANLCESLFQMQPDFSIEPNLAESFAVSDDNRTYTFQIRDDVTFWDGSPMTAGDVAFSLQRHLDPQEASVLASSFEKVTSIEQTGEWEVTLELSEPNSILTEELATNLGAVVQQAQREDAGENYGNPETGVMCTGPFQFTPGNWKQGQSITLERYDGYWNEEKRAKAGEVEIGFVVDPTAIANGLSTGETQGTYDVPLPALGELSASESGTLTLGEGMQIMAIISTGNGAFGDPAVRRALTRATDREAIGETVYEGTGTASRSIVPQAPWDAVPEVAELRDEQLPDLSFDIDAAKAELEAAEVDTTQPIKIAYPSERSFYADILNEMASGAAELGLTLEPTGVPSAQFGAFFSDPAAREGYDGFVTTNYLSSPSPLSHLDNVAYTDSQQNYSGFSDPDVDAAIDAAYAESDAQKRAELTVEAEALVMEQQPWVPINDLAVRMYMDESVTGAPASFIYLYYPWAADLGAAE